MYGLFDTGAGMYLIRKSPVDRWTEDLRVMAANSADVEDMTRIDRSEYRLVLSDGITGTVKSQGDRLCFSTVLGCLNEVSERCGLSVDETYGIIRSEMTSSSLSMDENGFLTASSEVDRDEYGPETMIEVFLTWMQLTAEYRAAVDSLPSR